MPSPIGTIGTIPTLTVGGRVFTDLTTLIILKAHVSGNTRSTMRKSSGSTGYQVTAGKTYTVHALQAMAATTLSATGASVSFTLAQVDADIGLDVATAFTNPVYSAGAVAEIDLCINPGPGSGTIVQSPCAFFPVAATKYLGVLSASTYLNQLFSFGYET